MIRTIDETTLERTIVRHCSPTLAGLKPASLFTFPGDFVSDSDAASRRLRLQQALRSCAGQIESAGLSIRVLAWRSCGALIYVYRPHELTTYLADPRAALPLARIGYHVSSLDACLKKLSERFSSMDDDTRRRPSHASEPCPCTQGGCCREFPHELGFFLGYPYADVEGFIAHGGRNYLAVGPWKVYANLEGALAMFERFRQCADELRRAQQDGCSLTQLAVATSW